MSKKACAFRLPEKVLKQLKQMADLEGVSQSVLVERAVGLYVSTKLNNIKTQDKKINSNTIKEID